MTSLPYSLHGLLLIANLRSMYDSIPKLCGRVFFFFLSNTEPQDVESEWVYPENTFDLVHNRYMLGSIKDWDEHFSRVFR